MACPPGQDGHEAATRRAVIAWPFSPDLRFRDARTHKRELETGMVSDVVSSEGGQSR